MAIAPVTGNRWSNNTFNGSGADTTRSGTLAATVNVGELMVAISQIVTSDQAITFSDDKSNTWSSVIPKAYDGGVFANLQIGWAFATTGGTIQVTASGGGSCNRQLVCSVYTGADSGTGLEDSSGNQDGTGSSTTPSPGLLDLAQAGLIIAATVSASAGDNTALSGDYTLFEIDPGAGGTYDNFSIQERITTGALSENPAFGTNYAYWLAVAAGFRATGSGSSIAAISSNYRMFGVR